MWDCKHSTDNVLVGRWGWVCVCARAWAWQRVYWHMQKSRTKCVAKFNLVGFLFTLSAYWQW